VENTVIKTDYIEVIESLMADFEIENPISVVNSRVFFQDLTLGEPEYWTWYFGDGLTSLEQNPFHEYSIPGTYTVTLQTGNDCQTDIIEKVDVVEIKKESGVENLDNQISFFNSKNLHQINLNGISGLVQIELYSVSGVKISNIYSGNVNKKFTVNNNIESLQMGTYFYIVKTNYSTRSIKFNTY
jgi:hypothetical protein